MKRSIFATLALLGLLLAAPVANGATSVFTGLWTSTDTDGSTQYLTVSGGGSTVNVSYVDDFGSVCVNNGAMSTVFTGKSTGTVDGNTLEATFTSARCGSTYLDSVVGTTNSWTYDQGTDTLLDNFGITWERQ
jgi:hypothetical protein